MRDEISQDIGMGYPDRLEWVTYVDLKAAGRVGEMIPMPHISGHSL